jgi:hypothetical protein
LHRALRQHGESVVSYLYDAIVNQMADHNCERISNRVYVFVRAELAHIRLTLA